MFLGHPVLEPKSVCIFSSEKRKIDYDVSNISDEQSTHTQNVEEEAEQRREMQILKI